MLEVPKADLVPESRYVDSIFPRSHLAPSTYMYHKDNKTPGLERRDAYKVDVLHYRVALYLRHV
jgi:hypothetical protein